ncbi:hypothetical protein AB0D65_29745 [Streptomyces griseoloalbus]|uniref:Uncharacterized protein n=1 Tax=Streptomyces griseoloalbus TaxID=67303 RepID=A0ABV3ED52_9ACTN
MHADITIQRCCRAPGCRFWWRVWVGDENQEGFAHTERRARRKAERAAHKIATRNVASYSLEITAR